MMKYFFFFFSSRRRHTRLTCDWSSDVCSSDLIVAERELQALTPDRASGADLLGPRDLPFPRAGRGDREEEIRVRGPAGTCRPPVCCTPSRIHRVSSHGI